jgi:hypothetical protein
MEDPDEEDAIAAAMGFSSFGHSKKRKFDQTASPKSGPGASGANTTELGVRPKIAADAETAEMDAAIESVEADVANASTTAKGARKQKQQKPPAATGLAAFLSLGNTLPDKPTAANTNSDVSVTVPAPPAHPTASEMVSYGGPPISRAELDALRRGVKVENGDTAYFQPSFVEDPWERTKSRG